MTYLLFALGLVALFFGGEYLVRGATAIAKHFRLSPMVIGLTIVGFGTSAPEMLVSVQAAMAGQPAIAIGNVLGSNIANILLILGISALIAPLIIPVRKLWRDLGFMLLATAVIWVMLLDGDVTRLLVDSSTELARAFGISEAVIGLTIVAVGTSLPELATSVIAAIRKQTEIAVGNIVGSNIFNIFGILGTTALIAPIPSDPRFSAIDMPWVAASAIGLTVLAFVLGGLPRIAGVLLLAAYGGYVAFI